MITCSFTPRYRMKFYSMFNWSSEIRIDQWWKKFLLWRFFNLNLLCYWTYKSIQGFIHKESENQLQIKMSNQRTNPPYLYIISTRERYCITSLRHAAFAANWTDVLKKNRIGCLKKGAWRSFSEENRVDVIEGGRPNINTVDLPGPVHHCTASHRATMHLKLLLVS